MSTTPDICDRIQRTGTQQRAEAMTEVSCLIRDAKQAGQPHVGLPLLERTISRALDRGIRR